MENRFLGNIDNTVIRTLKKKEELNQKSHSPLSVSEANESTTYFPPAINVIQINQMNGGAIQQGTTQVFK